MTLLQLTTPKKRSDGPGCKVYQTQKKKFIAGTPQKVTAQEKTYLLETGLFEEVKEESEPKAENKDDNNKGKEK